MRKLPSPLLVVTDRHGHRRSLVETVGRILTGGGSSFWLRDGDLEPAERRRLASDLLALIRDAGGTLVIGRDAGLAAAIGADGVHLPGGSTPEDVAAARRLLPDEALVGVSAHAPAEIAGLAAAGIDYATLSPIFETASKPGYGPALGPAGIAAAAGHGVPVLALGGVTQREAALCRAAGAAGLAVMGGLMRSDDPAAEARTLIASWEARAETVSAR
ncbi:thiamine phosphate synthase [Methylobacterium segetis]|uniref:thiamine phosphate synthase n=1 Tax=Methylobacterium segetis TaxID=2488750 RepID=UPI0010461310|nr:thiamine phosphate synthase [Methylobacterium segetis]